MVFLAQNFLKIFVNGFGFLFGRRISGRFSGGADTGDFDLAGPA